MSISKKIREKLIAKGASLVGYADLSCIPREYTQGNDYGILIGVSKNPKVLLGINNGPTLEYYEEHKKLNRLLDELDLYTAEILRSEGFSAYLKKEKTHEEDDHTLQTMLPHKTVATRAGVGWIGKCALLVTKEFGSALRISSVLTNAVLEAGTPIVESKCGECVACKEACPAGAVSGDNWDVHKHRDEFYNAFCCRKTARERSSKTRIDIGLCGLCMLKCPWTEKYMRDRRPVDL